MGFKFRKSIKILPGVRVNVSNKGVNSVSVGRRGAKVNIGRKGVRNTVGIPGSGLSYSSYTPYQNKAKEQRSNYPTNLVSFVDCANNNRFYVSNGQVSEITKRIKNQP